MNYSTWETSRWHVYDFGGTINSFGKLSSDNNFVGILHLDLTFKIIDILKDLNKYFEIIIKTEEIKSNKKVTYKEKQDLKKQLKKVVKEYIKNRLRKGFENELFTVE